jgi:hypothetical protein
MSNRSKALSLKHTASTELSHTWKVERLKSKIWFVNLSAYIYLSLTRRHAQVTDTFGLHEYQQALDKMNAREALKVCIKP